MAENICRCFKKCGGCQLAMSYDEQLAYKNSKARRLLSRFGKVKPILAADDPYRYRSKVQTVYKTARSGEIVSGVFRSSDKGMTVIDDCMIEDRRAAEVIRLLKPLLGSFRINPYNPKTGKGVLRHTLIRVGSKGVMLVLVVNKAAVPNAKGLAEALVKKCPFVTSVVLNVNQNGMPLTLGQQNKVLYGSDYVEDELCGCVFRISPQSFYQVNSSQTKKLYETAIEAAQIEKGSRLIDAYCGTGTIGIICEKHAAAVAGCELNEEAVRDARINAKLNKCENITFYSADAGKFMTELAHSGENADIVMMDPPRAGASREFLAALCELRPRRVVYVSCKIETLARDLVTLSKAGYKADIIQPVDMFPHTTGTETVVGMTLV